MSKRSSIYEKVFSGWDNVFELEKLFLCQHELGQLCVTHQDKYCCVCQSVLGGHDNNDAEGQSSFFFDTLVYLGRQTENL